MTTPNCMWAALASLILLSLHFSSCPATAARELSSTSSSMADRHEQWMAQHGRVYKDAAEKQQRFNIFRSNVEFIESFNAAGKHKYWLRVNQFADLTNQEFKAIHTGFTIKTTANANANKRGGFKYGNVTATPVSIDWRTRGAVTPIKDQGQCGS